jgi:hypothetical protein
MSAPRRIIIRRPQLVSTAFYIGCIVLAAAMWGLTNYINSRPYVLAQGGDPATALSSALDAYAAMNNLLTTLSTGLLAGLGLFLTSRPKQHYAAREFWPAAMSGVCVCVSLYWAYISSQNVEWAIENSVGTLDLDKIQWPRQLQCLAMLLGVVFFADFVRRDLTKVR